VAKTKKFGAAEVEVNIRDRVAAGLKGVERKLQGFGSRVGSIGKSLAGVGAAATGAFAGLGAAVLYPTKLAAGLEQTTVAFTTMLGSAEKANTLLAELKEFAAATPLQFQDIADAARNLAAFGVEAGDVTKELKRVGDISSAIGAPIGEIAEIYGKAKVQGRLFGEDINQLTGRGIPIIGELAKQFGVAESAVKQLVADGAVNFGHLQQAFADMTSEGGKFAGMMEAQSKTLSGRWSTLKDNIISALIPIGQAAGEVFGPLITAATKAIKPIAEFIKQNSGIAKVLVVVAGAGIAAGVAITGLGAALIAIGSAAGAISTIAGILSGISLPVIGATAAVAALVGGLGYLAYQTGLLQAALGGIMPILRSVAATIKTTFGGIMDALAAGRYMLAAKILWQGIKVVFLKGADGVLGAISWLWNNAWSMTKKFVGNLIGTLVKAFKSIPGLVKGALTGSVNIGKTLSDIFSGEVQLDQMLDKPIAQAERRLQGLRNVAARQRRLAGGPQEAKTAPAAPKRLQQQQRQAQAQQKQMQQRMAAAKRNAQMQAQQAAKEAKAAVAKAQQAAKVKKAEPLDKVPGLAKEAGTRTRTIESRGTSSAAAIANGFFGNGRSDDQRETAQNTRKMVGQMQKLLLRRQPGFG
jgi:tape measure domain-containing protein